MDGRLIPLAAGPGAWNMSVDQALLESVEASRVPVLRLYQWSAPTLSLGYFQKVAEREQHTASQTAEPVRRSTGGGAILHHHDLTYSIALPMSRIRVGARHGLYRDVHESIAAALAEFGIRVLSHRVDQGWTGVQGAFLCFQRRTDEDLVASGYKILGSAQRRSRSATLQHGSLLLAASDLAPELPGVTCVTGKPVSAHDLSALVAEQVGNRLSITWNSGSLTQSEQQRAKKVQDERFGARNWFFRR